MEFRLRDFGYPLKIYKFKNFLEQSQWYDEEKLLAYQYQRLKHLLKHCYENVPYYTEIFDKNRLKPDDIKNLEDLKLLPILTRECVRNNFDKLTAKNIKKFDPMVSHTSGSTGTALEFYLDRDTNILEFATIWRFWNWTGYRFGDKFADLRGRVIQGKKPWIIDYRLRSLNLSSFRLTRDVVKDYATQLRKFKPKIIRGYPSSISLFAKWLQEEGIDDIQPVALVTSAETLLAPQRQVLEEVFNCKVYDWYGIMERVAAIGQCEYGNYHINSEYGIVEILDENGNPVQNGERGEIIATSLHNHAMPFIRYRTNDLAVADDGKKCECGRSFPLVKSIFGRVEDFVVTPDGRYVGRLDAAFKYSRGIKYSQIIQETKDEILVKIVRSTNYNEDDEKRLLKELKDRLGEVIKINIQYVDNIELTKAGKLKFVISKVRFLEQDEIVSC